MVVVSLLRVSINSVRFDGVIPQIIAMHAIGWKINLYLGF